MSKSNRDIRNELISDYGKICMAGGEIDLKINPLTMHHIQALHANGKTTYENGSNICSMEHCGIHSLSDISKVKERTIKDQINYWKEIALKLTYAERLTEKSRIQFHHWLLDELEREGFQPRISKDKKLIMKRVCNIPANYEYRRGLYVK